MTPSWVIGENEGVDLKSSALTSVTVSFSMVNLLYQVINPLFLISTSYVPRERVS